MFVKIDIANLGKCYGKKVLFSNISAQTASGQCLVITGCNGSGKSTLLKIVAGLVRPTTGQIRLTLDNAVSPMERIGYTGLVSPDMSMYLALTGIENIMFWTKVRGFACSRRELEEICCQVGLGKAASEPVATYSTGMRQRLKLAVLKAIHPPIWLLDEPSSNLDESGKSMVQHMIAEAVKENAVVILATNEAEETIYATSKIAL